MTVTTRVKEFEQTPSASLTLQQFNRVDLETEADPPAFTKNRMMEARARAIQDKNINLLTSGALDDPMKSKKINSKWRDGKSSEKNEAFEKLYKSLEAEIDGKKNGKSNEEETEGVDEENDAENNKEKEKSNDTNGDEQEDQAGDKGTSALQSVESEKAGDSANDDEKQLTTTTNPTEAKWDKAYPKSSSGKKIILPDHATPEERLPPTQPVEGTLDTSTWRKDMPQDMIDDIESIFRNPTEVAQKEAIFNKINKDYIIVQAQKEKSRTAAEQADKTADKDMIEQTQGMERYRKRKSRGKDGTTEEALLEVVANRKISRKINYDAMSSIFDDGSFSTGGVEMEDPFAARETMTAEDV
jgi:transcription factor IIIB subunit 2